MSPTVPPETIRSVLPAAHELDLALYMEAWFRTTGADVHSANELLTIYLGFCDAAKQMHVRLSARADVTAVDIAGMDKLNASAEAGERNVRIFVHRMRQSAIPYRTALNMAAQ